MNLKQKAAKGILWSIIQKWGRAAIWFVTFVALSRLLAPEAFGLVALASTFMAFIEIFLDQGFSAAIIQRADLEKEHLDTAFWISILIGILMTIGTISLSPLVAAFFKEPHLAPILKWLSVSFIFRALSSTQMAILQRKLAFKSLAARSLVATLFGGIVGVSMAFTGFGVWSLVGQNLAMGMAGVVVLWRVAGSCCGSTCLMVSICLISGGSMSCENPPLKTSRDHTSTPPSCTFLRMLSTSGALFAISRR